MQDWTQTLGAVPLLLIAAGAIALILILIIWARMHAFLVLVLVSLLTALATGIPIDGVGKVLIDSFSGTVGAVALLVGLGAMLGALVETSGGARVLAEKMVSVFGEKRAAFALGVASLIMGFPMFFDAGLIVMLPVIFAVGRRIGGKHMLLYGISAAAAFSVMHVFVPPHPGPITASETYGANLGLVLLIGIVVALPTWYLTGYLWAKFTDKRIPLAIVDLFGGRDVEPTNPPKAGTVIGVLAIPLVLILLNTGMSALVSAGAVDGALVWVQALRLIGTSQIALLISVLVALFVLGTRRGVHGTALEKIVDSALGPICSVVLITGAGGMFGGVLRASGIGSALSDSLSSIGIPVIFAAYLIAVVLRVAQGSATVALVTAAGLVSPAVLAAGFSPLQVACVVLATAAGSVFAGHVNDSGFWLVGRLMGMDVKTTLKTWTVQQALESVVGFAFVLIIFGAVSLV
ncbi:GntP family permease [Microbacterium laevaniformans]|uniref:GntP family permease n=1 Tax=Microbacterium laevaniformans TaxID=36807 RepID=A0A4S2D2P8_9MICO|nr:MULTISPECIES: GntP family permease [Microbacterium]AXA95395.1 permease [Microbacterium sp. PM5]TGY35659.1 GntP family permease [Microbacterium laevaniformans]